ncbi:hypothetical protein [Streptomyces spinosisporus]|uniref:Minor capsid protein n=1 Tax=Streptomyces spinosisporus TaxID=2927582 RepID=A0ABS9XW87_9ACTN|nr:hypothetical protein [Streptomyces spinosisporus]MCI3246316.1 hypothetical protein [Streptomyces spinosisporus]
MAYNSDRLARLVQDDHTGDVIALENQLGERTIRDSDRAFEDLIRRTLAAWTRAFGGPNQPSTPGDMLRRIVAAARAAVRRLIDDLAGRAPDVLAGGLGSAIAMGVRQGTAFVQAASGSLRRPPPVPRVGRVLRNEARRIRDVIAERRGRAVFLLHPDRVSRWSHLLAGLGAARAVVPAIRAHIAWVINTAVHEGLDAVVRATAPLRVWVSEADACVRCLAYTGRVVKADEPFPGGLSWDPRQRRARAAAVEGPPLHSHCRCRVVPWDDAWTTSGIPFPLALQRETHRSIGYGRARPSESRAARLRAARELLRTVDDLLPAVDATARTAIRTGRFPAAA